MKIISLLFIVLIPVVLPANILFFFPGGNVSHKIAVWPWVLELAKRDHNVTFISPHGKTPVAHANVSDYGIQVLMDEMSKVYQVDRFKDRDEGHDMDYDYQQISTDACKAVINSRNSDPTMASVLGNVGYFDLVVINSVFGECGYFVGHHLKAKTIAYDSCTLLTWFYDTYGVSPESAWIPDLLFKFDNMPFTFWDRAKASYYTFYWAYDRVRLSGMLQEAVQPLFQEKPVPTLYELENTASFVFLNSHPSIDFARTLPPLFIDVGGMACSESTKELPSNFKEFMDRSGSSGVVLISFGSSVLLNTVASRYQAMFFHLIHSFPNVRFIMRWSGPLPKFLDKPPKNLLVSDWLPQKEILNHPKLKLFVTHGGVSSIQEATYYGVPVIVIPLFADQDYNGYRVQAQEVGMKVEIRGMTEDTLVAAVDTVLKNDKFKKNMLKKQSIFKDRPLTPVETAVFWTEFALRNNDTADTFRPANQHLNIYQRRLMDVYAFYFAIIALLLIISAFLLKFVVKCICFLLCGEVGGPDRESAKKRN